MSEFGTKRLPEKPEGIAPDGTALRALLRLASGSLAHFELAAGKTSRAVEHRTVEEIWFFLGGRGEMWRKQGDHVEIAGVDAGVCLTIPLGTQFQFRSFGEVPLAAVVITMPPWPGNHEAHFVGGNWEATAAR